MTAKWGIANIFASYNNVMITLTDITGAETITKATGGMVVKQAKDESSPYAAQKAAEKVAEVAKEKDFVGMIEFLAKPFDKVVLCVPKDMFEMLIPSFPDGKLIAVTNKQFKKLCKEKNWSFYMRKGARVGNANADAIVKEIEEFVNS